MQMRHEHRIEKGAKVPVNRGGDSEESRPFLCDTTPHRDDGRQADGASQAGAVPSHMEQG
jgi:hypothetical protein